MKCQNCKDPIPKGKEKYAKGKVLCEWCFERIKQHKPPISKKRYIKWVLENMKNAAKNNNRNNRHNGK